MDGIMALDSLLDNPLGIESTLTRRDMLKLTGRAVGTGLAAYLLYDCLMPGKAHGEMRAENGYTFDYKEDGWEVRKLYKADGSLEDGVKFLGERWEDRDQDGIPESYAKGYRLPKGRIITTLQTNPQDDSTIFSYTLNRFGSDPTTLISRVTPYKEWDMQYKYKIVSTNQHSPFTYPLPNK